MTGPASFDERLVSSVLDTGLADMGLAFDEHLRARLVAYLRLLHRWNRVYNLSAVRNPGKWFAGTSMTVSPCCL